MVSSNQIDLVFKYDGTIRCPFVLNEDAVVVFQERCTQQLLFFSPFQALFFRFHWQSQRRIASRTVRKIKIFIPSRLISLCSYMPLLSIADDLKEIIYGFINILCERKHFSNIFFFVLKVGIFVLLKFAKKIQNSRRTTVTTILSACTRRFRLTTAMVAARHGHCVTM